jgi:hypothetical protein
MEERDRYSENYITLKKEMEEYIGLTAHGFAGLIL